MSSDAESLTSTDDRAVMVRWLLQQGFDAHAFATEFNVNGVRKIKMTSKGNTGTQKRGS